MAVRTKVGVLGREETITTPKKLVRVQENTRNIQSNSA